MRNILKKVSCIAASLVVGASVMTGCTLGQGGTG